ncbi:MAG: hypothetical protein A2882_08175 [Phenylobacterium sp. RIFCSPHIGHO2_01_FULL_70_10]|nr:MAG: hypothetical protein A2882_08175 [Phenylobacterium sp. RIFCSPHIGHO2_01_FULL_70_10]
MGTEIVDLHRLAWREMARLAAEEAEHAGIGQQRHVDLVWPSGRGIGVDMGVDHAARPHAGQHDPGKDPPPIAIGTHRRVQHRRQQGTPLRPGRAVVRAAPVEGIVDEAENDVAGVVQHPEPVGLGLILSAPHRLWDRQDRGPQGLDVDGPQVADPGRLAWIGRKLQRRGAHLGPSKS